MTLSRGRLLVAFLKLDLMIELDCMYDLDLIYDLGVGGACWLLAV